MSLARVGGSAHLDEAKRVHNFLMRLVLTNQIISRLKIQLKELLNRELQLDVLQAELKSDNASFTTLKETINPTFRTLNELNQMSNVMYKKDIFIKANLQIGKIRIADMILKRLF